jgi:hypothetical protein
MLTTEERSGKNRQNEQRSAMNAFRHGVTGQVIVMPDGDMQAYHEHQKSFFDAHQPKGPVETTFVQFIADSTWKITQGSAWQAAILSQRSFFVNAQLSAENHPEVNMAISLAMAVAQCTKDISNLSLYERRNFQMFEKSLQQLAILQEARKKREKEEMAEAAELKALHDQEELNKQEAREEEAGKAAGNGQPAPPPYSPVAYNPSQDGFVFSLEVLEAYHSRAQRRRAVGLCA